MGKDSWQLTACSGQQDDTVKGRDGDGAIKAQRRERRAEVY